MHPWPVTVERDSRSWRHDYRMIFRQVMAWLGLVTCQTNMTVVTSGFVDSERL